MPPLPPSALGLRSALAGSAPRRANPGSPSPLPPPVRLDDRVRTPSGLVSALRRLDAEPRRVAWALWRLGEHVLAEAERRRIVEDDRPEMALAAWRGWALSAGTEPDRQELVQAFWDLHGSAFDAWKDRAPPLPSALDTTEMEMEMEYAFRQGRGATFEAYERLAPASRPYRILRDLARSALECFPRGTGLSGSRAPSGAKLAAAVEAAGRWLGGPGEEEAGVAQAVEILRRALAEPGPSTATPPGP